MTSANMLQASARATEMQPGIAASPGVSALSLTGGMVGKILAGKGQRLNRHSSKRVGIPQGIPTVFTKGEEIRAVVQEFGGKTPSIQTTSDGRIIVKQPEQKAQSLQQQQLQQHQALLQQQQQQQLQQQQTRASPLASAFPGLEDVGFAPVSASAQHGAQGSPIL